MEKSIGDIPKKRGRPPQGGRQEGILVRMPQTLLDALDRWANANNAPTRPEAVRQLVEFALKHPAGEGS